MAKVAHLLLLLALALFFAATVVQCNDNQLPNIMGADMIGRGFDGSTLAPRTLPIVKYNWNDDYTDPDNYWINPFAPTLAYRIPEELVIQDLPEAFIMNGSSVSATAKEYVLSQSHTQKKKRFLGFGSKSTTTYHFVHKYYREDDALLEYYHFLTYYKLTLPSLPIPALHPQTAKAVARLPRFYKSNPNTPEWRAYRNFIAQFGTHFMSEARMGGVIKMTTYFHRCLLSQFNADWVVKQSGWSFLGIINYKKGGSQYKGKVDIKWEEHSENQVSLQGGFSNLFDVADWTDWLPSVKQNPFTVSYAVEPIYSLIKDSDRSNSMAAAIKDYLSSSQTDLDREIAELSPNDPFIKPSWCTKPF